MGSRRFTDNARSYLLSGVSAAAGTFVVPAGHGALFAVLPAGKWQDVTLDDGEHIEICRMTARAGDALTVLRGQDGTAARDWPAGTPLAALVTAAALNELEEGGDGGDGGLLKIRNVADMDYTLTADDANAYVRMSGFGEEIYLSVWVPADAEAALPVGCRVFVHRGAGDMVRVRAAGGVTLNFELATKTYVTDAGVARLVKVGANEWDLFGDLRENS